MAYYSLTNGTLDFTQVNENDDNKSLLTFYFVNPAGNRDGMDDLMKLAYEATVEKFPPKDAVKVLSESECCNLPKAQLKSRESVNIFVFTDFNKKNEAFNYILTNKTVYILGSRCLLTILLENIPTPADIYHIHNLSMKNLVITTTSMTKEEKLQIKELVNFMGGNYIDTLKEAVTHLVSSSVRSVKYEAATKNGIVVMHPKWVENVWEKCQSSTENIVANDKSFNRFKLPVFYNLRITSTGYKVPERNRIKEQVESAGGTYSLSFTKEIDILIMEKDSVDSEKCKMAIKLNKFCLSSAWITESVDKGYAVPFTSYIIKGALKASTPTKDTNVTISKFNPDCTEISQISFATSNRTINMRETQWNETSKQPSTTPDTKQPKYKDWLEKITLADAKKCGNILDGFNFFLSGFTAEEVQFLGKVLSVLGGTKVDNIKDQVTHVIVGATDNRLFLVLDDNNIDPSILSVEWIHKVVEQKAVVAEPPFEIKRLIRINPSTSNPSPASKKAMRSLNGEFKKPMVSKLQLEQKQKAENDKDMELVSQYLGPPKIASVSQSVEEEDDMFVPFLTGKYVFVFGFTESNQSAQVIENCELLGATLVDHTFDKEVDYAITDSIPLPSIEPPIKKYKHLVTNLWLVESLEIGGAIDISFYHRPVAKVVEEPLKGETLVVTNYKGNERKYIHVLVEALGGKCSEVLRKFEEAILVTPTATGKKFESAKAWNAAVVKLDWLLECITKKRRVDETPYLIGGTSPSNRNIRNNESIVFSSQDVYDDHDPPIENYNDDPEQDGKVKTPIRAVPSRLMNFNGKPLTPEGSPNLNISRLLVDMPTPQREVTRAALLEARKPVESPRKLRLEKLAFTPTTKSKNLIDDVSSPTPQFPPCMRKLSRDYGIRPDSSPATQAFHKRKLEALDQNYRSPPKRSRAEPKQNEVPTPPLSHRRYDFFKARIQGYDSPDPRKNTQLLIDTNRPKANVTEEASKFLNLGDDETALKPAEANTETDDAFKPFNELEVQKTNESSKKGFNLQKMIEEEMQDTEGQAPFIAPFESEALVEWKDQSDSNDSAKSRKSEEACQSGSTAINKGSGHVFAINGLDEAKKADFTKRITKLGGKCDNVNFTHLIAQTPNRSEKFLSSIACGRFIVHPNYILECEKEGRFVDESKYEFGNPLFVPSIDKNMDQQGFKAPFNWRKWIKLDRRSQYEFGAFTGMNFVIAASPEKTDQMKNIIVSGGGKFVDVDFKAKLNMAYIKINHVNYCLFEAPKYLSEENKKILKLCKVESCSFKVVPLYLMSSEPPVDFP